MTVSIPRYQQIARQLGDKLRLGVLAEGDKLPSVRMLSQELGVSINTVQQAYYCLEAEGLVEARPQSGYYVRTLSERIGNIPRRSAPQTTAQQTHQPNHEPVLLRLMRQQHQPGWLPFSLSVPAPSFLPISKLSKALQQAQRELPHGGIEYELMTGNAALRRQIARYALFWGSRLTGYSIRASSGELFGVCYASCNYVCTQPLSRDGTVNDTYCYSDGTASIACFPLSLSVNAIPNACLGATVSLSAIKNGVSLSYQWYKNGTAITNVTTATTLSLTNVQPSDAGTYLTC